LVEKVGAVSEALQVSAEAKKKVETILKEGREVDDLKIASINGKPIYLGDIAGIGSTLAAAINRIRKIRLKL
jgi:multidrug efflux pump subunit AcrB